MSKKLYRSSDNVILGGVVAGIAEYFNQDPTIWRLFVVLVTIFTGGMPIVFIYLIAWVIIPVTPPAGVRDVEYTVHE